MNKVSETQDHDGNERRIIVLLVLLTIAHVFIFSAAFPFFNDVDEQQHLDLVVRYSHAEIPRKLAPPLPETLRYIALFGTPEYLWDPKVMPGGVIEQPPWTLPIAVVQDTLLAKEQLWLAKVKNQEVSQPPVYYSLAGLWWRLCQAMGFKGGGLLYNVRFFNVFPMVALVLTGWLAARRLFPANRFIHVAVPGLIAFMPQTAFYSINNDILAPLMFGLWFLFFLKFYRSETPKLWVGLMLGLTFAGTYLTKISTIPLLAVAVLFLGWKVCRVIWRKKLVGALPALLVMTVAAAAPIAAWMVWCKKNFGDYTGSSVKVQFLNWTDKPFAQWFHHPLFTLRGFWIFLSGNLSTFWQGEFLWRGRPLAIPDLNRFYVWFTLVLLLVALIVLFVRRAKLLAIQRMAMWFGLTCLAAMLGFFALLSVKYDFHDCYYPSTAHPYFTSGRLMLGLLVPFLLVIALGLDRLMGKLPTPLKFTILWLLLCFMLVSEITVDWKIFPNPYNWFHM